MAEGRALRGARPCVLISRWGRTTRPERLQAHADRGVRVRRGDYDDPASLRDAFSGADQLLLVSAPRLGEAALKAHRAAIAAAEAVGVAHVYYTSHVGADALSPFPPARTHAATETLLQDSGLRFTALRNGFYANTPIELIRTAQRTRLLRLPEDAPISWTSRRDLAPAIAALLLAGEVPDTVVSLTVAEAFDAAGLGRIAAAVIGAPVDRVTISDDEYRDDLLGAGVPEIGVLMSLTIFLAARQRRLAIVDPVMGRLLGRAPARLHDALLAALT